ncbi:MAG: zf-HC2 domain-containing protein [bacterium]|nr:zf-HC2 domain-containing protein [bacterium]
MTCETIRLKLADYILDNLNPSEQQEIRVHLEGCAVCRNELELLTRVEVLINAVKLEEPPIGLWEKIEAKITTQETKVRASQTLVSWFKTSPMPRFATIAILLIIVGGGLWWRFHRLPNYPVTPVQTAEEPIEIYMTQHTISTLEDPVTDKNGIGLIMVTANELTGEL